MQTEAISSGAANEKRGSLVSHHVILISFILLTIVSAARHEPWRDEGDVWLAVRDSPLGEILSRSAYAGTPVLWYAMVKPLAVVGLPYQSMWLLHLLLAWTTAALVVYRSPFQRWERAGIIFSYFVSYEWAVIARNYAVGVTLLALLAVLLWRPRFVVLSGFLIALLVNTSVHGLAIGAVLFVAFGLWVAWPGAKRSHALLSITIAGLGILLAVIQLWPEEGGQFSPEVVRTLNRYAGVWALQGMIAPGIGSVQLHVLAGTLLIVTALSLPARPRLLFIAAIASLFGIFLFGHAVVDGYRHFGFLWFCVVLFRWWGLERFEHSGRMERYASLVFRVSLVLLVALGLRAHVREITLPFSGSVETARFLRENASEGLRVAFHPPQISGSILLMLPDDTRAWFPAEGRTGTFMRWDRSMANAVRVGPDELVEKVRAMTSSQGELLLVTNTRIQSPSTVLLFESAAAPFGRADERFFVYEVRGGRERAP